LTANQRLQPTVRLVSIAVLAFGMIVLHAAAAYADITVTSARIGCLDIQLEGNLTQTVAQSCDGKKSCAFKAPTEAEYTAAGIQARTRPLCTQAMEISYTCGPTEFHTLTVPGDAWNNPPAALACGADTPPPKPGAATLTMATARIGCLDIQLDGNLTSMVASACNDKASCSFKAPTEAAYKAAGVQAATRPFCTQAMEIIYRCGGNGDQIVTVPGDAWTRPPVQLVCNGTTIASNRQDVLPPPAGSAVEPLCVQPTLDTPTFFLAPIDMLDWTPNPTNPIYLTSNNAAGFLPIFMADRAMYNSARGTFPGAPGSTLGANEGRVRAELRALAMKKDPRASLCEAAQRFTRNQPASSGTPSDEAFGNAFADLSVTGKAAFAEFVRTPPTEANLANEPACAGASSSSITSALVRAYLVANVLRGHEPQARAGLAWIAVSGEDDQPYRPVNVHSATFPQFQVTIDVPIFNIPVNTRYMIAHARNAPTFNQPTTPLVESGPGFIVQADPLPALAADAQVLLFIHGGDSRLEEAEQLSAALTQLGGKNWTIISMDLPTSGYADNIDPGRISPASDVGCHNTPVVDFVEEFIVAFVDRVDLQLGGQLKPRIKAVVGGSLGGNMAMRIGRRPNASWVTHVVPWSPASIWPSFSGQHDAVAAGCDTGWNAFNDYAVNLSLKWSGKVTSTDTTGQRFLPSHETPELRRELFYGGFDWSPAGGLGGPPQAQCWMSDSWACKQNTVAAARMERQETYDANFRAWHWRLGAEQLAFSHQQFAPGTTSPLYLLNVKPMLLLCGYDDTCGKLCEYTRDVASKMVNTPGYARFMKQTGHSLDNEYPNFVARQIADFLAQSGLVSIQSVNFNPPGPDVAGEYVIIHNDTAASVTLTKWTLRDATNHRYTFPAFALQAGSSVKVWTRSGTNDPGNLFWGRGSAVWTNTGDTAILRDQNGVEVSRFVY
jgi:pimeloyl-ACP methyl ester carboxylesterase